jgi:hypothetical protein
MEATPIAELRKLDHSRYFLSACSVRMTPIEFDDPGSRSILSYLHDSHLDNTVGQMALKTLTRHAHPIGISKY